MDSLRRVGNTGGYSPTRKTITLTPKYNNVGTRGEHRRKTFSRIGIRESLLEEVTLKLSLAKMRISSSGEEGRSEDRLQIVVKWPGGKKEHRC